MPRWKICDAQCSGMRHAETLHNANAMAAADLNRENALVRQPIKETLALWPLWCKQAEVALGGAHLCDRLHSSAWRSSVLATFSVTGGTGCGNNEVE